MLKTYKASQFGLHIGLLSPAILDVIDQLSAAGYDAYIVGGSVRDSLLGLRPKDFDAVTNATPEQIKKVFTKRCRIIGRRFELAHVFYGRDLIEVATFRAPPAKKSTNDNGMIVRDNNWGNIKQDFARRDFTINALYYQPRKDEILDYGNGMQDIKNRTLRFLGKPEVRFEEDPVRILRVLRFSAKLGFNIDAAVVEQLNTHHIQLLKNVSPHRLYDETNKMFTGGSLGALLQLLVHHHVWPVLFPNTPSTVTPFILAAAENSDKRIRVGKSINPAFFYAVILWHNFMQVLTEQCNKGVLFIEASHTAAAQVLRQQNIATAIPKFIEAFIKETWHLQPRLIEPKTRQVPALALHPRFRAAYDFLVLRADAEDNRLQHMANWWTQYQNLNNDQKEKAILQLSREQLRKKREQVKFTENSTVGEAQLATPNIQTTVLQQPDEVLDDILLPASKPKSYENRGTNRAPKRSRKPRDLSLVFMGPY